MALSRFGWVGLVIFSFTLGAFVVDDSALQRVAEFTHDEQRTEASSNDDDRSATTRKKRAAICWMGVAQDWPDYEENTVVTNVLQPLVSAGYDLRVFLVAQTTSRDFFPAFREPYSFRHDTTFHASRYVPDDPSWEQLSPRAQSLYQQPGDWMGTRTNSPPPVDGADSEHAVKAFAYQLQTWLTQTTNATTGVQLHEYEPIMNPPIPPNYFQALVKRDAVVRPPNASEQEEATMDYPAMVRSTWRIVNHLRHLHASQLCAQLIMQQQQPPRYKLRTGDLLIALGDDAQVMQPIPMTSILDDDNHHQHKLQPGQMLVLPCSTHRHMPHDQVHILVQQEHHDHDDHHHPDTATTTTTTTSTSLVEQVLTKPYQLMTGGWMLNESATNVSSMADFLQRVYQALHVTILVPTTITTTLKDTHHQNATVAASDWKDQTSLLLMTEDDDHNGTQPQLSVLAAVAHPPWDLSARTAPPTIHYPLSDEPYLTQTFPQPAAAPNNNHTTKNATNTTKSALICVTGQLQRMEFDNKIRNLLEPMSHEYDIIDLVVIAYTGQAHFQPNKGYGRQGPSAFATEQNLTDYLAHTNRTSLFHNITVQFLPPPKVPMNPQYLLMNAGNLAPKFQRGQSSIPESHFMTRFDKNPLANLRMMESYQHCYNDQDQEYDLYVRLRDDVGFDNGPIPPALYNATRVPMGALLTHGDRGNGGINDRMAFVNGRASALCYFHLPYVTMFNGKPLDRHSPNTETYFKRLYWLSNGCLNQSVVVWDKELHPLKVHGDRFVQRRRRRLVRDPDGVYNEDSMEDDDDDYETRM